MKNTVERRLQPDELIAACRGLLEQGGRLHMTWAWFPEPGHPELCYLTAPAVKDFFEVWRCKVNGPVPSLGGLAPLISWYEREIHDLCGVPFSGQPEPYPLVLHEGVRADVPPLDPRRPKDQPLAFSLQPPTIPEVLGPDVQELPFGPVRAGVVEAGQFFFFYIGEHILHYRPRLFFKHRGMEKRFEGVTSALGAVLAERVSGVGSVAHALAYCEAVEAAAALRPPPRARTLRVVLAELERLYNHLHYLGHLADATTLKVGHAEGALLAERLKQLNARLTGSRFLRNLLVPGGLRRDLAVDGNLARTLAELQPAIRDYIVNLERTTSYRDRLHTTGYLPKQVALDQGATGPVARASGVDFDLRRDFPYAAYQETELRVPLETEGDAWARARVRAAEIDASLELILRLIPQLPPGEVRVPCVLPPRAEGLGWSESPRGALFYAVHADADGRLARVKIKSPSFSNWRAFPYTVHRSNMMDYAINEASFGLTIAGCDR